MYVRARFCQNKANTIVVYSHESYLTLEFSEYNFYIEIITPFPLKNAGLVCFNFTFSLKCACVFAWLCS